MDHLFVNAAAKPIRGVGAEGEMLVSEHALYTEDFETLCLVGID